MSPPVVPVNSGSSSNISSPPNPPNMHTANPIVFLQTQVTMMPASFVHWLLNSLLSTCRWDHLIKIVSSRSEPKSPPRKELCFLLISQHKPHIATQGMYSKSEWMFFMLPYPLHWTVFNYPPQTWHSQTKILFPTPTHSASGLCVPELELSTSGTCIWCTMTQGAGLTLYLSWIWFAPCTPMYSMNPTWLNTN